MAGGLAELGPLGARLLYMRRFSDENGQVLVCFALPFTGNRHGNGWSPFLCELENRYFLKMGVLKHARYGYESHIHTSNLWPGNDNDRWHIDFDFGVFGMLLFHSN